MYMAIEHEVIAAASVKMDRGNAQQTEDRRSKYCMKRETEAVDAVLLARRGVAIVIRKQDGRNGYREEMESYGMSVTGAKIIIEAWTISITTMPMLRYSYFSLIHEP